MGLRKLHIACAIGLASLTATVDQLVAAGCEATFAQYQSIKMGMPEAKVLEVVGCEGDILSASESSSRTFKTLEWKNFDGMAYLSVDFENGRVTEKSQFGLR